MREEVKRRREEEGRERKNGREDYKELKRH
jgi:hypothetical protein